MVSEIAFHARFTWAARFFSPCKGKKEKVFIFFLQSNLEITHNPDAVDVGY